MLAGVKFIWRTPVVLTSITLDMFAVLLGGATALLRLCCARYLHVGGDRAGVAGRRPRWGQCFRCGDGGATSFSVCGADVAGGCGGVRVGDNCVWVVEGFTLSLVTLALLGGLDNVSVVIRSTLLLTRTPDALQGG